MMKTVVRLNIMAVHQGLRKVYHCVETNDMADLDGHIRAMHLARHGRYIFDPFSVSVRDIQKAERDDILMGKYLGYLTPGDVQGKWWISWEAYRREGASLGRKYHLFHYQSKHLHNNLQRRLVDTKKNWNALFEQLGFYIDFNLSFRENENWNDLQV